VKGNEKMERSKQHAIPFLVKCKSHAEAAREIGVSEKQIYEWLKDPEFKAEIERQRNELTEFAINILRTNVSKAAQALADLVSSENEVVRRGACNDILDHLLRFKEKDHEARILALEEGINGY
jgi:transposase-like protein